MSKRFEGKNEYEFVILKKILYKTQSLHLKKEFEVDFRL